MTQPRSPPSPPSTEDFAALLDETFPRERPIEGSVVTGTIIAIDNDEAVVDVGLKAEGRVPLKEFSTQGIRPRCRLGIGSRSTSSASRTARARPCSAATRRAAKLEQAGAGLQGQRQGPGHDLRPRQGRLRGRPRRRDRVPAGQPGGHSPGARRQPVAQQGRAVPDPQDGPAPRQHRGLPPRRARVARRAAQRAAGHAQGRPGAERRGQEHHGLRRVRRSRRPGRPAARHRHLVAARQPRARCWASARRSRCR